MAKILILLAMIALSACATTYAGGEPLYDDGLYDD